MTKRVKGFTANYNGEANKPGEVMIPFEFTEDDAENCINPDCIKTIKKAGRNFRVIYKAVPAKWAKAGKSAFNLVQNEALGHYDVPNSVSMDVLSCRQQLAKSSVSKYTAMSNMVCADNRARGCFMFYGANRSGRWAGRGIQLQNLPQNHMDDLKEARNLVHDGNFDALELLYDNVPEVLSELIRTAFIPKPGYKYIVSDFSAIEARVLSFLAGEQWRMDVFEQGKDIYCASASQMFKVPVEKHGQNSHLRQKGKIAELALGYGGSVGALKAMGALDMGLEESELQPLVDAWRQTNPNITAFWWTIDAAVKQAVIYKTSTETHGFHPCVL